MRFPSSIRGKITLGYFAAVAVIIGLSLFTLMELWYLEEKITFANVIGEFFDMTLEIRRFEKNFFLYEQQEDYRENMTYVVKAQAALSANRKAFKTLLEPGQIGALDMSLTRYKQLVEQFAALGKDDVEKRTSLGIDIRRLGKEIVTIAESLSNQERRISQLMLRMMRDVLIFSIILLSLIGIAIGQFLSTMVVRPLKELEQSMEKIALGGLEKISMKSKDREIVSLTNAFNKMLRELELRQRHILQSEKLASLGTLMAGIAHEINNPLSNISTSCQILEEEIEDPDLDYKKQLLTQIEEQTDRARNIVRSLLDFSREKVFKRELLPLRRLVEDTVKFIKAHIPAGVSLRVDIPEDVVIFADKQRMQQAFLNLIKNAAESIEDEGTVSVTARKQSGPDSDATQRMGPFKYMGNRDRCVADISTVDIEIKDTGSGIPPEHLERIFDPFFTTKDVGKGSGLGLSIVYEIIDEHGGCIAVDSMVGKGTTFLIRLPAKE
jgi:two-component system, NtrC family, sensor kinase